MDRLVHLNSFFKLIEGDPYLGPAHISLYMALFNRWILNEFQNPFRLERAGVMRVSKINSRATYQKCIHDLHTQGYIRYIPSFNHVGKSMVCVLSLEQKSI